jgi:hypothetical protein
MNIPSKSSSSLNWPYQSHFFSCLPWDHQRCQTSNSRTLSDRLSNALQRCQERFQRQNHHPIELTLALHIFLLLREWFSPLVPQRQNHHPIELTLLRHIFLLLRQWLSLRVVERQYHLAIELTLAQHIFLLLRHCLNSLAIQIPDLPAFRERIRRITGINQGKLPTVSLLLRSSEDKSSLPAYLLYNGRQHVQYVP